jgi:SAM-dependent methyltransferase
MATNLLAYLPATHLMSDEFKLHVPATVYASLVATQGVFVEGLSGIDRDKLANDLLDPAKADQQAQVLMRYVPLSGKRVLEIGSGLAMNMIVWHQRYGADVIGVEPDAPGFDSSFKLGRELAEANGLDPQCIINAVGESLPFPDGSFDVVFSANVLEHTDVPEKVLEEAVRVLRPGGVLQFVYPNHTSYYDGHYGVFHPPILWRGFFPWYVRWIWRRDPAFARTLRTELNASWTRRQARALQSSADMEVLGLGTELFLERMTSLDFGTWASLGKVKRMLDLIGGPKVRRALGRFVIGLNGWTPIVLTLRKPG